MDADVIVIGSGYGGAFAARPLVDAGLDVLLVERGGWVPRGPWNAEPGATVELSPFSSTDAGYRADTDAGRRRAPAIACVGGQSVFAGAVAMRYRAADFRPPPAIVGESRARWPFGYAELEPWYERAERVLGVAGRDDDPTAPPRRAPYPFAPPPLAPVSERVAAAGRSLGLTPFRLPLAIDDARCSRCETCDTFACARLAKNDAATALVTPLVRRGLRVLDRTTAIRLIAREGRVTGVRCADAAGRERTLRARTFVLAGGALATPHLLLASGLQHLCPAGDLVGRYLIRHCNAIAMGVFARPLPDGRRFHKHVGFHDLYFAGARWRTGGLQQVPSPPLALVGPGMPRALRALAPALVARLTGLLAIAEDRPQVANRVVLDRASSDRHGVPALRVEHRYAPDDLAARARLVAAARRILRRAGALGCYVHEIDTFSHAAGTVRMGVRPDSAPLDADGRLRGTSNLYVSDASALPTSAAVNPSLTIAANALRIGAGIAARVAGPRLAAEAV